MKLHSNDVMQFNPNATATAAGSLSPAARFGFLKLIYIIRQHQKYKTPPGLARADDTVPGAGARWAGALPPPPPPPRLDASELPHDNVDIADRTPLPTDTVVRPSADHAAADAEAALAAAGRAAWHTTELVVRRSAVPETSARRAGSSPSVDHIIIMFRR